MQRDIIENSIKFKKTIKNKRYLPKKNLATGDTYVVLNTGILVWAGKEWVKLEGNSHIFENYKEEKMTSKELMLEAIKEAYTGISKNHGGPFGAVVVMNGKIIGRGHNMVLELNDPTCHGEIMAIRDACRNLNTFDLTGATLYTTGYPCPMCLGAIQWANIDKVYYGCNIDDTEKIGFRDKKFYKEKNIPIELCRIECLKLYKEYEKLFRERY